MIELDRNLDVWTTDDTSPFDSEEVYQLRDLLKSPNRQRHAAGEDFFILSGTQQVLVQEAGGLVWRDAHAGDYVRVPGNVWHAHRNVSDELAIDLIVTTARLGRFFEEIGPQ